MRRHAPDFTSLIAGLTFCGLALGYIGGEVSHRALEIRWMMPILLIGLGLAGLAGTLTRAQRTRRGQIAEPDDPSKGASDDGDERH